MSRGAAGTGARRRFARARAWHYFVLPALAWRIATAAALAQSGGGADLRWSTVDGGSGRATSGSVTLYGTAGQPDTGLASTAALQLRAGFWVAAAGSSQTPGPAGSPTATATRTHTAVVSPSGGALATPTATGSPPTGGATPTRTSSPDATALGSVTASPTATPIPPLAGDANCDGRRSAADLPALLTAIADDDPRCGADANGDLILDDADVETLLALLFGG